mmetsp:Transcript_20657/g.57588  ORF Transcript_20657/g.57588 Transcript_20657/m.57588 type:complete len:231 (-) Transcript_20657:902-1594(-)
MAHSAALALDTPNVFGITGQGFCFLRAWNFTSTPAKENSPTRTAAAGNSRELEKTPPVAASSVEPNAELSPLCGMRASSAWISAAPKAHSMSPPLICPATCTVTSGLLGTSKVRSSTVWYESPKQLFGFPMSAEPPSIAATSAFVGSQRLEQAIFAAAATLAKSWGGGKDSSFKAWTKFSVATKRPLRLASELYLPGASVDAPTRWFSIFFWHLSVSPAPLMTPWLDFRR